MAKKTSPVSVCATTVQRTVEIPVTEATIELTEAEVQKALVDYARTTYAADLPPRKLLMGSAYAKLIYSDSLYEGHTVTLCYEAE